MAGRLWARKVSGVFTGSFLSAVGERVVCRVRGKGNTPVFWCLESNGRTAWEREFEFDTAEYFAVSHGRIYLDGTAARCLCVDTGETVIERDLGARLLMRPPTRNGPVYVVGHGGEREKKYLACLHPETLEEVWRWPKSTYLAEDARLCRNDAEGVIHVVDLATMKEREVRGPSAPNLLGMHGHLGSIWCQFNAQERFGVDLESERLVWRHAEKEPDVHERPVFADDAAYCGNRGLSTYELRTGRLRWRQDLGGGTLNCQPAVEGDRVYAATQQGVVWVLDRLSGEVLGSHQLKEEPTALAPLVPNCVVVGTSSVLYCLELS